MVENTPAPADLVEAVAIACPFCGSDEHISVSKVGSMTADMPDRPYRVICHHIDHDNVLGPVSYGRRAAIAAWNNRPAHNAHMASDGVVQADRDLFIRIAGLTTDGASAEKINKGLAFTAEVEEIAAHRRAAAIPFDRNGPCHICNGIEGCSHTVAERQRAAATPPQPDPRDAVIAELRKIITAVRAEAAKSNKVIALNRDGCGQGRIKVATAMHRIEEWTRTALANLEGK